MAFDSFYLKHYLSTVPGMKAEKSKNDPCTLFYKLYREAYA